MNRPESSLIGTNLAHYKITDHIGSGGMGDVYRALDTKLDREVALKLLPKDLSADPERIARFQREARTLASLQHPNIASIYGFEHDGDTRFLVMELVEGEDLAHRLERGRIPLEEATEIAAQICEGLESAHAQGIIHRDLKPANIKLTPDGQAKILDFGLARAYVGDQGTDSDLANSPTITAAMTQAGVILGTAAYMSPEQARGKSVDSRTDVWAFGVILYEMLSGKRLFEGDTISDTLAAVLRAEPEWDELPADLPPNVRRLLRRCLARNPKERLRSAGDARLELLETERVTTEAPQAARRSPILPLAFGALAIAIVAAAWLLRPQSQATPERQPTHLSLALPAGVQVASRDRLPLGAPQPGLTISDDGRLIVAVVERNDTTVLYRRFLDEPEGQLLENTAGAYYPRISPSGEWISFLIGNSLMRMAARGDRPTRILELPNSFGHCWINDDEIVINRAEGNELLRVDVERGTFREFERQTPGEKFLWPSFVPGANAILVNSKSHVAKSEEAEADLVSLISLESDERTVVGIGGSMPQVTAQGQLLLVRDGMLAATPFDLSDPERHVRPVTALEGMLVEGWLGQYALSHTGTMVYVPGEWLLGTELVWDDGAGNVEPLGFPLLAYGDFELSPDGSRLAITVGGGNDAQAWIYDLERGARRLLTTEGTGAGAIWSPDGNRLAFGAVREGRYGLYVRTLGSSGPAQLVLEAEVRLSAYAWHESAGLLFNWNSGIYRIDPDDPTEPELIVGTDASEWGPDISPDGRWIAYTSDESGRYEIYARALDHDRSWTVSLDGGEEPIWSQDGRTIFYRNGNRFLATPVLEIAAETGRLRVGRPEVVVEGAYSNVPGLSYDVHPVDGRLLLLRTAGGTERPGHLNVILDWDVELAQRMSEAQ